MSYTFMISQPEAALAPHIWGRPVTPRRPVTRGGQYGATKLCRGGGTADATFCSTNDRWMAADHPSPCPESATTTDELEPALVRSADGTQIACWCGGHGCR